MRTIFSTLLTFVLLISSLALVPPASAIDQNDASIGGDAPNASGASVTIALGAYSGILAHDDGDHEDWYRVVVPAGDALNLTFRINGTTTFLGVYGEDNTLYAQRSSSGNTVSIVLYQTSVYLLGVGSGGSVGTTTYTLIVGSISRGDQDDGGSGQDAPDASPGTIDVAEGAYQGTLQPNFGDAADRYRFALASGQGGRVTYAGTPGVTLQVMRSGSTLATFGSGGGVVEAAPGAPLDLSFTTFGSNPSYGYAFALASFDTPDYAVVSVTVDPVDTETPAGAQPLGIAREVTIVVENRGLGAGTAEPLDVWSQMGPSERHFASAALSLAPGASTTLRVRWDATGQLGDAVVHARAFARFDGNAQNDEATAASFAGASNVGGGVDILDHDVQGEPVSVHYANGSETVRASSATLTLGTGLWSGQRPFACAATPVASQCVIP